MGKIFYIADTHFGHKNILHYDNRPFFDTAEMEREMVSRWNAAVNWDDTVYILGDFSWNKERDWIPLLHKLNGCKVLIRGNHDPSKFSEGVYGQFVDVQDYMEIEDAGRHVVLSHYPIVCFKNHFYGWYHLYGHVHNSFEANMIEHDKHLMTDLYTKEYRMYNVGCMMPWMDYTPRTLDWIVEQEAKHGKV